jgi:hypothetical protein
MLESKSFNEAADLWEKYALTKSRPFPFLRLSQLYESWNDLRAARGAIDRGVAAKDPLSIVHTVK